MLGLKVTTFYSSVIAILSIAGLAASCGDDKGPTPDDRGNFGVMADALQSAEHDNLTENAEIFASANYMKPYIATLLHRPGDGDDSAASASATTSCLPNGIGGKIYTINGTPFTSIVDPAVPEHVARFRLFRLSNAGQPLLNQPIGHIEYSCVGEGPHIAVVSVVSGQTLVAWTKYITSVSPMTGSVKGLLGAGALGFNGSLKGDSLLGLSFNLTEGLQLTYNDPLGHAGTRDAYFIAISPFPIADWRYEAHVLVDQSNGVLGGYAITYGDTLIEVVSCIESGTVDSPIFSNPSTHCYETGIVTAPITTAQLAAMSSSYRSLRNLWLTAANLTMICRSLVPTEP